MVLDSSQFLAMTKHLKNVVDLNKWAEVTQNSQVVTFSKVNFKSLTNCSLSPKAILVEGMP